MFFMIALTLRLDDLIARVKARQAREAELRRRGLVIFRDWWKARQKRSRPTLTPPTGHSPIDRA